MDSSEETPVYQYKQLHVNDNRTQEKIALYARTSYQNIIHINRVNNGSSINDTRRDVFSAEIDNNHPNEELRGKKVVLKKIALTRDNELQCWREIMIGIEIKHYLIGEIVDNWIEVCNDEAANAYYVMYDRGGMSIKQALKKEGQLRRKPGQIAPIHFNQFLKIAHDLATTLIILKRNNVLHRDINISNILVHELNNMSELRTELIDFGWAKKIVDHTATTGVGTAGKNAPEITFRNKNYKSKICAKPYSYPVDVYALGQTLVETLEMDRGFLKVFARQAGFETTGNTSIDEGFGSTLFHLLAKKEKLVTDSQSNEVISSSYSPMSDLSPEQKGNMIRVHAGCVMPYGDKYKEKLERFLTKNSHGTLKEGDSLSQRFLRNFWFRHLDKDKGWTDARIDLVINLVMRMLNYWPEDRITCEQIYNDAIFKETDQNTGQLIITPKTDVNSKNIENMVKLAGNENEKFPQFLRDLAQQHSKVFIRTKYEQEFSWMKPNLGNKISIHTIEKVTEGIQFRDNFYKYEEIYARYADAAMNDSSSSLLVAPAWINQDNNNIKDAMDAMDDNRSNVSLDDFINQAQENSNINNNKNTIPEVVRRDRFTAISRIQQIPRWGDSNQPTQDTVLQEETDNNEADNNNDNKDDFYSDYEMDEE